jgi:hypothetical protein
MITMNDNRHLMTSVDGGDADVAADLELEHLDHVLKPPPADPAIEVVSFRVRVGEVTSPTVPVGQARAMLNTVTVTRRW